jgi:tetratricopeptide (TPR) repeat protein
MEDQVMPGRSHCPFGHVWEDDFDDEPSFVDGFLICPVCGPVPVPVNHRLAKTRETAPPGPPPPADDVPPDLEDRPTLSAGAFTGPVPGRQLPSLPGYELLGEIGRGGMGVVYKARQIGLNRLVALKVLLGGRHAGERQLARFRAEAEAVARLQHPNIVQIYEVGEHAGSPYFSLEFVAGGTLANRIARGPTPAREAAELVETLARAVHYAHERGIVHRDLKPANILITDSSGQPGVPKITDFGLAKKLDDDAAYTRTGVVVGTPQYMAPEQAGGRAGEVGPATDVYALGVILYELLAGRPPFDGESAIHLLFRVTREEAEPLRSRRPKTPRDLDIICLKCLHKSPPRRYVSALELADDLRRFLNHEPIRARAVGVWERGVRWVRRRPAWAGLAAGMLLATAALAAVEVRDLHDARQRRAAARDEARELLHKAEQDAGDGRYDQARDRLRQLGPRLRSADMPPEWYASAERLTTEVNGRLDARATHDQFLALCDLALFHAAPGHHRAAAGHAAQALRLVGLTDDDWKPNEFFTPEQRDAVAHGCLEMLLVLARAEDPAGPEDPADAASARRALAVLDRAKRLGLTTRAFHLRRAAYLRRAGDPGWEREQAVAERCPAETAFDHLLIGQEELSRDRLGEAQESFAAALRKQPSDFWAWYFQALCYVRLNQMALARDSLTAAMSRKKEVVWPYLLRGFASGQLLDYAAAEADFGEALARLEKRPDADARYVLLNNRAVVRLGLLARVRNDAGMPEERRREEMGRLFDQALADLREAVALKPEQYHAFVTTGQAFLDVGDPKEAVGQINKAIELAEKHAAGDDTLALFYRNRARWQEASQDVAAALASLRSAARLEVPAAEKAKALAETGGVCARDGRFADAVAACDEALRLDPGRADASRLRAECLLKLGRWAEAARAFDDALRPGGAPQPKLLAGRAVARMRLEPPDHAGAVADLTLALAVEPANAAYRTQRGQLYLALGRYEAALADFDEVPGKDPTVLLGRARARAGLGQHARAAAEADEAVALTGLSPSQVYAAGAVFALAAGSLDDLNRPLRREEADTRTRYQERALDLVRSALLALPPNERAAFWSSHPARDRALAAVRSGSRFRQLQGEFGPTDHNTRTRK